MKEKDIIEKVLEAGTFISFLGLIIVVLFQVITRFLLPSFSQIWTEEASRFLFIYSVAFAAPLAMKKNEYVNVDILLSVLPKSVREALEFFIYLATIVFFSIILFFGIKFAQLGLGQTSATMEMPMVIAYSSIPITALFIMIYAVYNFIRHLTTIRNRGDA